MKRSTTCDTLLNSSDTLQTVPNLVCRDQATPVKEVNRHSSLLSLTSIGEEESLHSGASVSSGSARSSHVRCPSFMAPPVPSLTPGSAPVVPSLEDEDGGSSSGGASGISKSPSSQQQWRGPLGEEDFRLESPPPDASPDVRMQLMIINELIQTELNYVASLHYVIQNYVPEMKREDLPQELRGQRYTIFGNLEKIYEFHIHQFLPQLQARIQASKHTDSLGLEVGRCFLEHRTKFHLYALYNKNKPQSERLMSECGAVFFSTRQLLLKDKLDLASYLLKPVQRMGKYALLLRHLLATCPSDDQETSEVIKKAEELVSFQLRHGNDLLAMDMIKGCDLNLKEQGTLLRQDEFVICEGRGMHNKKCLRRVFLFEHLVLFAKPRRYNPFARQNTLADTYQYKHSIKMSDVGLTEVVNDSELKFELWFRRLSSSSAYCFQSHSEYVRNAWVEEIRRLLWRQAIRNRENRLTEMSSMGIGSKTCVDLKTSGAIQNRAVNSSLLNKVGNRFRNSFNTRTSVSSHFPLKYRGAPKSEEGHGGGGASKRPHSLISLGSSSCSSNNSSIGSHIQNNCSCTPQSFESGMGTDLSALEEHPIDGSQSGSSLSDQLKVVGESNPVTV